MIELFRELARQKRTGERVAMATVVATRGSAPREAGARMLVWPDGRIQGTVGGGYPESEVRRAALDAIQLGEPRLVSVDMTAHTAAREGAICGGTMLVLVEPFGPPHAHGPVEM